MRDLKNINLKGVRVLLRTCFDVPMHNGEITDLTRITQILPTIEYLKNQGAKIILISHFGRPKGIASDKYSLKFLVPVLEKAYKSKVLFIEDLHAPSAVQTSFDLKAGEILLLENLRFYKGEESNDAEFAKYLSGFGDIYVNDAFPSSHREHASMCAITKFITAYPGFALKTELENLQKSVDPKLSPKVIIIAGLKVSTKFKVLHSLVETADQLIIGGAMANTFLKALGFDMANSFVEEEFVEQAAQFYKLHEDKLILPVDLVCEIGGDSKIFEVGSLPPGAKALDIGPKSVAIFMGYIKRAKLLLWNGPLGYYEDPRFAKASLALAKAIGELKDIQSILGGGDTLALINELDNPPKFSYLSSSGGAFLEWLESFDLPALKALRT